MTGSATRSWSRRHDGAVDATVTAGWFGLIGAAVGASRALVGGWLQQLYQAKTAKQQRRDERRFTADRMAFVFITV